MLMPLLVSSSMLLVTGCAPTELVTEFKTLFITEPPELQSCADEPAVPPKGAKNSHWGDYIAELRAAGRDCRDKVARGKAWNDQHRPKGDE